MPRIGNPFLIFVGIICASLAGCAVGPDFIPPPPPVAQNYIIDKPPPEQTISTPVTAGESQHFNMGQRIVNQWWELFHSEELNCLITKGFEKSPTVDAAQASLRQA